MIHPNHPDFSRRRALAAIGAPLLAAALPRRAIGQDQPPPAADPDTSPYPSFSADPSIKGTVRCVGSSSVGLLINAIRPEFADDQPDIAIEMSSSGSSGGPKALAAGECMLAPMSRPMKPSEIELVESSRKGKVDFIDIAIDAIAICVNAKNPLRRIAMTDLDRIFGRERRRGGSPAMKWSDAGVLDPALASRTIVLFGLGQQHGSTGLMQDIVLQGGAFRSSVNEEPVSSSVVQAVATDPAAIGYASVMFDSQRTRMLELESSDGSGAFVAPTEAEIRAGRYPLARSLRIYFVRDEIAKSRAAARFLQFIVSQDGQELIGEVGQKRLLPKDAHAMMSRIP